MADGTRPFDKKASAEQVLDSIRPSIQQDLMKAQSSRDEKSTEITEQDEIDFCSRIRTPVNYKAKASFFALAIITIIRIATFWQQKSISYFYGFKGTGSQIGDPKFEISSAYPGMESCYGALVGLFFTLPYAIAGLYTGSLTRTGNRKLMMIGAIATMSVLQLGNGIFNSLTLLCVFRFLHGIISSSINPMAFSLVSDYFPPDKRTTANSILSAANFVGIALSSMTILLINNVGWRASYLTMGGMGLLAASAMMLLKDPVRG